MGKRQLTRFFCKITGSLLQPADTKWSTINTWQTSKTLLINKSQMGLLAFTYKGMISFVHLS